MANKVSNPNSSIERLCSLRVALVHDDLVQEARGGEEVFLAISELFPEAPIYTSMVTPEWASKISNISNHSNVSNREIITSFMQKLPFKKKLQRAYFPLYPLAFESFDLSAYDLVISSSSRFAHGIITKPETKHICYMNNPGRMFWESSRYFAGDARMKANPPRADRIYSNGSRLQKVLSPALSYLRLWSYTAAQRVDYFITNSQNIARKIGRYFGREAKVVYPFVDLERFAQYSNDANASRISANNYFLIVSRLNRWKRVDLAIRAAKRLGIKLKIVGEGPERKRLEERIRNKGARVEFLGKVSPEELALLYQDCAALIMTQEEDFGITSLEVQASGRPVIAYRAGGALETIRQGQTGEFFFPQSAEALVAVLKKFKPESYDPRECRKNAERFSKRRFQQELVSAIFE